MKKLRQYNALPSRERFLLAQMAVLVVMAWLGLRLIGFKKMQQLAHRKITKPLRADNNITPGANDTDLTPNPRFPSLPRKRESSFFRASGLDSRFRGNGNLKSAPFTSDTSADIDYAQRCAELSAIAARHCLPPGSCLPQALALCWLLRKNGLDAHLKIGVKPPGKTLLAHAWVEYQNLALGQQEAGYQSFPPLTQ
ncbi:MAG: lasso peptide biosynthesis B2 protein [Porticoccaceae bacterium]|nr:lasso peptide biosynthesis B2 protein [Porticoccaceae bacterium]